VAAVVVAAGLGLSGVITIFFTAPFGPIAFPEALATALAWTEYRPGGPWHFTTATAYEFDEATPFSAARLLQNSNTCPAVGTVFTLFPSALSELPSLPGADPAHLAPVWLLTFGNASGALLEAVVVDGTVVPLAESSAGPPCGDYTFRAYPPLPDSVIAHSSTAIDDLATARLYWCGACRSTDPSSPPDAGMNATFELSYAEWSLGNPDGWRWSAWVGSCDPFDAARVASGPSSGVCTGWQGTMSAANPSGCPPQAGCSEALLH
jgi:hypothetical protein